MIRISLSYIFETANKLEALGQLPDEDMPWSEVWLTFLSAQSSLEGLYIYTPYAPFLRSSATAANELLTSITTETSNPDHQRTIYRPYTV